MSDDRYAVMFAEGQEGRERVQSGAEDLREAQAAMQAVSRVAGQIHDALMESQEGAARQLAVMVVEFTEGIERILAEEAFELETYLEKSSEEPDGLDAPHEA